MQAQGEQIEEEDFVTCPNSMKYSIISFKSYWSTTTLLSLHETVAIFTGSAVDLSSCDGDRVTRGLTYLLADALQKFAGPGIDSESDDLTLNPSSTTY